MVACGPSGGGKTRFLRMIAGPGMPTLGAGVSAVTVSSPNPGASAAISACWFRIRTVPASSVAETRGLWGGGGTADCGGLAKADNPTTSDELSLGQIGEYATGGRRRSRAAKPAARGAGSAPLSSSPACADSRAAGSAALDLNCGKHRRSRSANPERIGITAVLGRTTRKTESKPLMGESTWGGPGVGREAPRENLRTVTNGRWRS